MREQRELTEASCWMQMMAMSASRLGEARHRGLQNTWRPFRTYGAFRELVCTDAQGVDAQGVGSRLSRPLSSHPQSVRFTLGTQAPLRSPLISGPVRARHADRRSRDE